MFSNLGWEAIGAMGYGFHGELTLSHEPVSTYSAYINPSSDHPIRSMDPGSFDPKPLKWISNRICLNCSEGIEIILPEESKSGQKSMLKQLSDHDSEMSKTFLPKLTWLNNAKKNKERDLIGAASKEHCVEDLDSVVYKERLNEHHWYSLADYAKLGFKHTDPTKNGHYPMTKPKHGKGVAIFLHPRGCHSCWYELAAGASKRVIRETTVHGRDFQLPRVPATRVVQPLQPLPHGPVARLAVPLS